MKIRRATPADYANIWALVEPVFRAGETYPVPRNISPEDGLAYWLSAEKTLFVAEDVTKDGENKLVGLYYIKPNTGGGGDHICNCGYITLASERGKGIARQLCAHSLTFAKESGYRGMQYNLVISTNAAAVHLWQKMGFDIAGTLPGVFAHPSLGDVDAYVMFQAL